ncbi:MAG: BlaI/MecI/CopY family transcriptional regulator [Planctomycetes bacterium]|nr:BlaI/MecI/CopY family transcriptional regulator [Planctomycetota bacterium]
MHYIWKHGPSTVHDVHTALNAATTGKQLAYTTILTVMRNLARRKFLSQAADGRAHRFTPLIDEKTYKLGMVRQLRKDLFAGDIGIMLSFMALDDEIEEAKRAKLRDLAG